MERLWKIYRFDERGYAAAADARRKVAVMLDKAASLRDRANQARKDGLVNIARTLMKDSFSMTDAGIHLQDKLIIPFTYEAAQFEQNLLLNEGITRFQNLLIGGGGTPFNNASSYLGTGDSSTAASATQTGLQAATNKLYKGMDTSYPSISNQTTTWQATFGATDANFAWNEFTVANGSSDASENLNRKVSAQGTKASGQVWTLQLAVTWS